MNEPRSLPDTNRLGVLLAAVLLAYALTRLIQTPELTLELQLPGFYLAYPITLGTVLVIMAAGLTATGMHWLLRSHSGLGDTPSIEYWLLPTLAAFIIGIPLTSLPTGAAWLAGFSIGGLLLALIITAEYIVVEPSSPSYPIATAGLTALSFAIYLILTTALRYGGARLFILAPVLFVVSGLVSLRTIRLRTGQPWDFKWALGIALVCVQLGAGLHYWPVSIVQFGLALLGPLYGLSTLAGNLMEGIPLRRGILEPLGALSLSWLLAFLLG